MRGWGRSNSFLTQVKKILVSALPFAIALIMFNYYTYHFTKKSGFRQNFMSHGWRNRKKKKIVRKKERKPGEKTKKEIIKEPEPDIGLYPNERLPLQSNSKGKNINTIILFFFFSLFLPILMQLLVERSKKDRNRRKKWLTLVGFAANKRCGRRNSDANSKCLWGDGYPPPSSVAPRTEWHGQ